jgi:Vault protein inter-alpha-trypsin domain
MRMTAPQIIVDPLHALVAGGLVSGTKRPVPLVAARFNVDLNHGLATVSATRIFKNAEETSIEATITFPVPVHAVLFSLTARIAGRVLKARAQRKSQARDDYEDAIERGKTAVLHEEVLRGVHMLSVGHVPAGVEVEVSATWTMTLTNLNGRGYMRIPLTVGDIYGRSGLPDSDDLTYGVPYRPPSSRFNAATVR